MNIKFINYIYFFNAYDYTYQELISNRYIIQQHLQKIYGMPSFCLRKILKSIIIIQRMWNINCIIKNIYLFILHIIESYIEFWDWALLGLWYLSIRFHPQSNVSRSLISYNWAVRAKLVLGPVILKYLGLMNFLLGLPSTSNWACRISYWWKYVESWQA